MIPWFLSPFFNDSVDLDLHSSLFEYFNMSRSSQLDAHAHTVFPHSDSGGLNHMQNYTFYKKETSLMFVSNIASACLVVVGIVSNILTLAVLDAGMFSRTSFCVYLKWVSCYHLISLILNILRQHSFLLDFEDKGREFEQRRFWGCTWLLWFNIEVEHGTQASLGLLVWNRIWAQRNVDRSDTRVDAMRLPIVLNVCCLLLMMVISSSYIETFNIDAEMFNMTMCSFSFVHTYGSPGLQTSITYNMTGAQEVALLASFVALIVEMTLRAIRQKTGGRLRMADFVGEFATPSPHSSLDTSDAASGAIEMPSSISKARLKANSLARAQSQPMFAAIRINNTYYDERDRGMSNMTVVYMFMYFAMGMPIRIVHYFILTDRNDFPMIMMLSLLRQSFQAGTIFYLYMGSSLVRQMVRDLSGQLPATKYTSSTALFEPSSRKDIDARRSSRWSTASDHGPMVETTSADVDRAAMNAKGARNTIDRKSSRLADRVELGLNKHELSGARPTLVMRSMSQTQTPIGVSRPSSTSTLGIRQSLFFPTSESDV